jgi:hypothetical protein
MLVNQGVHCTQRVAMQTVKEPTRSFGFGQAKTAGLIFSQRNLLELLQQVLLTFGQEQDLILSEVPQFAGRFASADAALMAAKPSE